MEIVEMLNNYGFITVDGMDITVEDFIGFDDNWCEEFSEEYEAMDEEEAEALSSLLEDLVKIGYTVHWTSEDI